MKIEDNTILIAPSALHLRLYEEIFKQKGSCLNITVLSLEAYLNRKLHKPKPSTASLLYDYAAALDSLPKDNMFYGSRKDYDFLKACQDFMVLVKLYDIKDFPQNDQRQKDLYAIIERLMPIELWVEEAKTLPFEDASQLRILNTETNDLNQYWVDLLKSEGAKELGEANHRHFYYWAASNPRKEMEVAADAIVANKLPADSVFIALAKPEEKYALAQALESRRIPYTFVSQPTTSKVLDCGKSALRYLAEPNEKTRMDLLKTFFPVSGYDLRRYLDLFENADSNLSEIPYVENPLISEQDYADLQALEMQCTPWRTKLREIQSWDLTSIEAIGQLIMDQFPQPSEDDVRIFGGVVDGWNQIKDRVKTREDLHLFLRSLDALHPSSALPELKGVLIGNRDQVSSLFDNVFYIGADASNFPGNSVSHGVFGEDYLEQLDFPSLESRMNAKLEQLKSVFMGPQSVYFLTPQSDYEGKSVENSHELNTWLEVLPQFKVSAESSINQRPSFQMNTMKSQTLYEKPDSPLTTGVRQLQAYEDCPLKNLLEYGLHLRKPILAKEIIRLQVKEILPLIMRDGFDRYGKSFYQLSEKEIADLVDVQFVFARQIFPARKQELDTLAAKTTAQIVWLFENLAPLATHMNLDFVQADYHMDRKEEIQGIEMQIEGSLTRHSASHAAFNLYPPASQGFSMLDQPSATLDLRLQPKAQDRPAFSLSYNKGAQATAVPITSQEAKEKGQMEYLKGAMVAQNLGVQTDPLGGFLSKKVPTYEDKESKVLAQADQFAQSIKANDFIPLHKPSACQYCAYKAICRNAAIERSV